MARPVAQKAVDGDHEVSDKDRTIAGLRAQVQTVLLPAGELHDVIQRNLRLEREMDDLRSIHSDLTERMDRGQPDSSMSARTQNVGEGGPTESALRRELMIALTSHFGRELNVRSAIEELRRARRPLDGAAYANLARECAALHAELGRLSEGDGGALPAPQRTESVARQLLGDIEQQVEVLREAVAARLHGEAGPLSLRTTIFEPRLNEEIDAVVKDPHCTDKVLRIYRRIRESYERDIEKLRATQQAHAECRARFLEAVASLVGVSSEGGINRDAVLQGIRDLADAVRRWQGALDVVCDELDIPERDADRCIAELQTKVRDLQRSCDRAERRTRCGTLAGQCEAYS